MEVDPMQELEVDQTGIEGGQTGTGIRPKIGPGSCPK